MAFGGDAILRRQMRDASGLTPMFRQYRTLKQQRPDSILLFRMGDFYEMFFDDAKTASRLLELTLTARGKGTDNVVPMCGFPYHQLEQYTTRLVRARQKVAIQSASRSAIRAPKPSPPLIALAKGIPKPPG